MYHTLRQTYRHFIQQQIVQREMRGMNQKRPQRMVWEAAGMAVLFSTAAACGTLAQLHLG